MGGERASISQVRDRVGGGQWGGGVETLDLLLVVVVKGLYIPSEGQSTYRVNSEGVSRL